jgi:hypothetical protein
MGRVPIYIAGPATYATHLCGTLTKGIVNEEDRRLVGIDELDHQPKHRVVRAVDAARVDTTNAADGAEGHADPLLALVLKGKPRVREPREADGVPCHAVRPMLRPHQLDEVPLEG